MSVRKKAVIALLITSLIWGIAPPLIKYTLNIISTETYLFYRFLLTCLILIPVLVFRLKHESINFNKLSRYALLGFLSVPVNLLLLFWGINLTSSNDSSVISIISPILIILGGAIFLHEKVTHREKFGILITVIGTILTIIQPVFESNFNNGGNVNGNLLVLGGTIAGTIFTLLYKQKQNRDLDPMTLTAISFLVGILVVFPLYIFQSSPLIPPLSALPGILYMAVFGSAIAYFTSNYGLSKIEASEATLFTYLQPVIAVPLAVIFLHEPITPIFIIGSIFILTGLLIAEARKA